MSKEIWEKNIEAMKKWYPDFADLLLEKKDIEEGIVVSVERSLDGEKIFRVGIRPGSETETEEKLCYLGGKRNAREPVQIWLERMGELHRHAPVFLFGAGSGAYLKALVKHTQEEVNIVVYEPSVTIFRTMLSETDLSEEITGRPIAFLVEGINETEFEPVMDKLVAVESLVFLKAETHPGYRELFGEKILEYVRKLQRRTEAMLVGYNSGVLFAGSLAQNVLQNMKYVCDGYNTKKLSDTIPHDGPAILVAAGPSLNKNIQELKKAKNKAFILAVDTAIKPLVKAGIIPDAFFTIDPHKPLDLIDIEGAEQIPVIAPTSANHALLDHQKGKKIFYFDGYAIPYHIYSMNQKSFLEVSTGGSVACNCFSVLFKMGFNTIILVGQDLAYTNNKSHADGTFQEEMPQENTKNMIMVKGNYEEQVPTLQNLRMYLDWFAWYVKGIKKRFDVRVINATEGGAWIEGTELMTLKDAIAETCKDKDEFDFTKCISQMESEFTKEERAKAVAYLHTVPEECRSLKKLAGKLNKAYRRLAKLSSGGQMNKEACVKQLERVKKLTKQCYQKEIYQLVEVTMPGAQYIVRSEFYEESDTPEEEAREIARKGIKYSGLLEQCADVLKEIAERELLPIEA